MRIGVSTDGSKVDRDIISDTPQDFDKAIEVIKKSAQELMGSSVPYGVAGGIAGTMSRDKKSLASSPNISHWIDKPLVNEISKLFGGAPVFLENDAVLAGLGEAHHGAGRGFGIVAYITVSTGVGGARIVNGRVDDKSVGFEPGHQIIDADQTIIPSAKSGMLEDYISGTAVFRETGKKPKEITDPKFWDAKAKLLAYGLANVVDHWSPDVIVLGGSMITGDPAIPIEKSEMYFKEILKDIYKEFPKVEKAELGDVGGLHGALEYLKQQRL